MKTTNLLSSLRGISRPLTVLSAFALLLSHSFAASGTWATATDGNWTTTGSWSGGVPTTNTDTATLNGAANYTTYLDTSETVNSLVIGNTGTTTILGGVSGTPANRLLTFAGASSGFTINSGAGSVTIGNGSGAGVDLQFQASGTSITNNSSNALTINNGISVNAGAGVTKTVTLTGSGGTTVNGVISNGTNGGALNLTVASTGTTTFNATGVYTGTTTISGSSATIVLGANNAFGSGVLNYSSAVAATIRGNGAYSLNNSIIQGSAAAINFGGTNSITLNGSLTNSGGNRSITNNISGGTLTLAGPVYLSETDTAGRSFTISGTLGNTVINGVVANNSGANATSSSISVTNTGTTTFNNSNTFTGGLSSNTGAVTVVAGADNAFGTAGTVSLASGGVITLGATKSVTLSNNFSNAQTGANVTLGVAGANSAINFTGNLLANGGTITNNLTGAGLSITGTGTGSLSTSTSLTTATLAGTGNTSIANSLINSSTTGSGSSLTITNTGVTTLSGSNTFTGSLNLNSTGIVKLANAAAVSTASNLGISNGGNNTLFLANDSAISNLKFNNTAAAGTTFQRIIVDRATAGAAVDQTVDFTVGQGIGQQTDWTFQKGGLITSGTPTVTLSGTTVLGKNNSGKQSILNPLGVNLLVGNVTTDTGAGSNITSTLVLDGNSTGNKLTGVISNGTNTGTVATASVSSVSGNTITVASATGYFPGMFIAGTGIPTGTIITGTTATTISLSQTPSSASGTLTATNANALNLLKAGPGTWSLSGANAFSGTTTVQGGTLNLDFSATGAPQNNILYNTYSANIPQTTIGSGNLQLTGKGSGGNNTQTLGILASTGLNAGKVTVGGGTLGNTLTLQLSGLTMNTNSTIDFSGMDANNVINTGTTSSGVQSRATVNNYTDFATIITGSNLVAAGSAISTALPSTGTVSSNYTLTGSTTLTGNSAFKTIRASAASGTLNLGGFQLQGANTSNSALLYNGGGTYNITNGTITSSSTAGFEFNVFTSSGSTVAFGSNLNINDNTGATSLLVAGLGTVSVTGAKNYTGVNRLLGGTYAIDTIANGTNSSGLGASSNVAANLILNGATLKYTGTGGSTDRSFTIGANGATIDASGTGALSWSPAVALAYSTNQNQYLTLTGTSTAANSFGTSTGGAGVLADGGNGNTSLTKAGSGTWLLTGSNTYTGSTFINGGILGVVAAETAGTSGPLGKQGPVVFGGGTLQYSSTNQADYSKRILISTSDIKIDTNGQNVTFATPLDASNSGGLTKLGSGTLTISAPNYYSGLTTVSAGTLATATTGASPISNSSGVRVSSGATFAPGAALTFASGQSLSGAGSVTTSAITIASGARLAPGDNASGNFGTTGTLTFASGLTINSGALLSFDLGGSSDLVSGSGSNVLTLAASGIQLTVNNGGVIANGTYTLFSGFSSLSGFTSSSITLTNSTSQTVAFANTGTGLTLTLSSNNPATGSLTISAPSRVITGSSVVVTGTLGNTATAPASNLAAAVTSIGTTTVGSITTGTSSVAVGNTTSVSGSFTAGSAGTTHSVQLLNTDSAASPTTASSNTASIQSVGNRVVTASAVDLGRQFGGASLTGANGTTTLTSLTGSNSATTVTVGGTTFNGATTSGTTTATGNIASVTSTGTLTTLTTTGEGLSGETPNNVTVGYTATAVAARTITPGSVSLGKAFINTAVTGTSTLTTTGADSAFTRVTVNGTSATDGNGASVAAGTTTTFSSGSSTTDRVLTGNFSSSGSKSGTVGLSVTGEGLTGESTNAVNVGYTATVYDKAVLTGSQGSSTLSISNASGANRAAAVVTNKSLTGDSGWSVSGFDAGTTINAGSTASATPTFNATGKLSGITYTASLVITLEHADQTIAGASTNDLGTQSFSLSASVGGSYSASTGSSAVSSGTSYTGIGLTNSSGLGTTATFLGGSATSNVTVSLTYVGAGTLSDRVDVTAPGSFVFQLNYDPTAAAAQAGGVNETFLAWLNPSSGSFDNAIVGNTGNSSYALTKFFGSYASFLSSNSLDGSNLALIMGAWGIDTANNTVWAVLNHNSEFTVVPEPSTYGMLVGGLLMLALVVRRRKDGNV